MNVKINYNSSSPITSSKDNKWKFIDELYFERFTKVSLYRNKKHKYYGALKQYIKTNISRDYLKKKIVYIENEIKINKMLNGIPNIVPLWFYYETNKEFGLMTKYMNGGTLLNIMFDYKSEFDIIHDIIYPLLTTIRFLHKNNIVHRDLKPANLFIHNKKLYVGDFGYSYVINKPCNLPDKVVGTIQYMAPELLENYLEFNKSFNYSFEIDIWSIGIILYELIFHMKPFGWSNYRNICVENPCNPIFIRKCINNNLKIDKNKISEDCEDFLKKCLHKNPKKRYTIQKLLEHKWILKYLNKINDYNSKCHQEVLQTPMNRPSNSGKQVVRMCCWKNHSSIY